MNSPSHEAEIVIVDIARTERVGFMDELPRVKVMTTRANFVTVYVGNSRLFQRGFSRLHELYKWLAERKAVRIVHGAAQYCSLCCRVGHVKTDCPVAHTISCHACQKARRHAMHSGRNCPHSAEACTGLMADEMPLLDNISRDVFGPVPRR
jgi:hypothetical protein